MDTIDKIYINLRNGNFEYLDDVILDIKPVEIDSRGIFGLFGKNKIDYYVDLTERTNRKRTRGIGYDHNKINEYIKREDYLGVYIDMHDEYPMYRAIKLNAKILQLGNAIFVPLGYSIRPRIDGLFLKENFIVGVGNCNDEKIERLSKHCISYSRKGMTFYYLTVRK